MQSWVIKWVIFVILSEGPSLLQGETLRLILRFTKTIPLGIRDTLRPYAIFFHEGKIYQYPEQTNFLEEIKNTAFIPSLTREFQSKHPTCKIIPPERNDRVQLLYDNYLQMSIFLQKRSRRQESVAIVEGTELSLILEQNFFYAQGGHLWRVKEKRRLWQKKMPAQVYTYVHNNMIYKNESIQNQVGKNSICIEKITIPYRSIFPENGLSEVYPYTIENIMSYTKKKLQTAFGGGNVVFHFETDV